MLQCTALYPRLAVYRLLHAAVFAVDEPQLRTILHADCVEDART